MQLSTIKIDGFGVLSHLEIDHLSSGLNVLYGRNGSGKTTVLQFLRGMFCNFDQARRLRLLPPLKGGNPGGALEVAIGPAVYEIIRHSRPGHHDTLAIRTQIGDPEASTEIRQQISRLKHDFIKNLFFVSGPEAHSIDEMVRFALKDGIELRTERKQATWIAERIEVVEQERQDLFGPEPSRTSIESLEHRKQNLDSEIKSGLKKQKLRDSDWYSKIESLKQKVEQLRREGDWLHSELQQVQADLTEVNDRLWSRTERIVVEEQPVKRVVEGESHEWIAEIAEIDQQISHAQQVLRDLANSRFKLSIAKAELTGTETPEQEIVFERQRDSIAAIEAQTVQLAGLLKELKQQQGGKECLCQTVAGDLGSSLTSIQQQIALLCQELSRQQVASEQMLLLSQRDGVDRCEVELTRQIQGLRLRRDELLHSHDRPADQRLQFCTRHETAYCQCEEHQRFLKTLSIPKSASTTEIDYVSTSRTVVETEARSGDRAAQKHLLERKSQLQRQWWNSLDQLARALQELNESNELPRQYAMDDSIQQLQLENSAVEQQLADAREQWHSLAVLQTVLQRTRDKMNVETASPVVEEASNLLNKMTQGRYTSFRFNSQLEELLIVSDQGAELPVHALSRGTLEQASLSFRLALWSEYRRRGYDLPLILDEVLADSDENRLSAAIETLVEFSAENHQIIFMTCQEHLANLFEQSNIVVQNLPGSQRSTTHHNRLSKTFDESQSKRMTSSLDHSTSAADEKKVDEGLPRTTSLDRIQPDNPFWIQTNSAVSLVPSLGEQMARRIGAIGVHTVSDLIDLDPENTEIPLESLQISAATLRNWQAEARLLCCIPDLTGKDAQLLVLCGVYSPTELAEADADGLHFRASRLQEVGREYDSFSWLSGDSTWPSKSHFVKWIACGQRARSYRAAREYGSKRLKHHGAHTVPASHSSRGTKVSQSKVVVESSSNETQRTVRLHEVDESTLEKTEYRFYLDMESAIVDAPSIGPKTAARFEKIGVMTVSDLVNRDAAEMSTRLNTRRLTETLIQEWQQQAILVCRIPELRGHDAQVLVACELTDVDKIAAMNPKELFSVVKPYVHSSKGQRQLRSAKTPDLVEVTDWIEYARNSRSLRAA